MGGSPFAHGVWPELLQLLLCARDELGCMFCWAANRKPPQAVALSVIPDSLQDQWTILQGYVALCNCLHALPAPSVKGI